MLEDTTRRRFIQVAGSSAALALAGCSGDDSEGTATSTATGGSTPMSDETMMDGETAMEEGTPMEEGSMMEPTDPSEAERVEVDRFSEEAGTLMVRSEENSLPGPDEPIDFDQKPFFAQGFGPDGEIVQYYNFDVQPLSPAPIYVFVHEGSGEMVEEQLNVIDVIPGDEGYNDFWNVHKVMVPDDYTANSVTSVHGIEEAGYEITQTQKLVNCPVVPDGSTASKRAGDAGTGLVEGWYDGKVVSYFAFKEAPLSLSGDSVPLSPIYVTFNKNPEQEGGGPPSGFMTEDGSEQNHNVVASLPGDEDYSPLWLVNIYDNADFDSVSDLDSAMSANVLANGAAHVNCPVVSVQ